jgi:hypothetical protein
VALEGVVPRLQKKKRHDRNYGINFWRTSFGEEKIRLEHCLKVLKRMVKQ